MFHRMYLRRCSMSSISEESETTGDLDDDKQRVDSSHIEIKQDIQTPAEDSTMIEEDDLDFLLEQLHRLEQRLSEPKEKKEMSFSILSQFNELDQALAILTNTINNVEIELTDSGHSSSSSSTHQQQQRVECEEHYSDSGLSQSTDSISLPLIHQQLSNASSILSCDTMKFASVDQSIRVALEKMHRANIKKVFVKIHFDDRSTHNLLIDETMTISEILLLLFHRLKLKPTLTHSIVEELPDLHLFRIFEDHQNLINDALIYWSRDTTNRIRFHQHSNRFAMFEDETKTISFPSDVTTVLYIKEKTKKIWKKFTCVLRPSGIYQIGKTSSKRDLVLLLKFEANLQLYFADRWIEALRSPTQYGFALKSPHIQKKSSKYVHYFCTHTSVECQRWVNAIRLILFGDKIAQNYQQIQRILRDGPENFIRRLPTQRHFSSISIDQIERSKKQPMFFSLDRHRKLKSQKVLRTKSTSPSTDGNETNLKRSKSARDIFSRPKKKESSLINSSSSILQCLHADKSMKRSTTHNHIYDSLDAIPLPIDDQRETVKKIPLPPTRVTEL